MTEPASPHGGEPPSPAPFWKSWKFLAGVAAFLLLLNVLSGHDPKPAASARTPTPTVTVTAETTTAVTTTVTKTYYAPSPGPTSTTPTPPATRPASPVPSSAATPDPLADLPQWERDNAMDTSDWWPQVGPKELSGPNTLRVRTALPARPASVQPASEMCFSYAQYAYLNKGLGVVEVLASDGSVLKRCGPDR